MAAQEPWEAEGCFIDSKGAFLRTWKSQAAGQLQSKRPISIGLGNTLAKQWEKEDTEVKANWWASSLFTWCSAMRVFTSSISCGMTSLSFSLSVVSAHCNHTSKVSNNSCLAMSPASAPANLWWCCFAQASTCCRNTWFTEVLPTQEMVSLM